MTLGAEPKKVAILGALVVVAVVALYINSSGDSSSSSAPPQRPAPPSGSVLAANASTGAATRTVARSSMTEIHPRVLGTRPDDAKTDPASINPDLRLDLLAKVQAVLPIEAGRNLFQFGAAPPPDKPMPAVPKGVPQIPITQPVTPPPTVASNTPPPPPPAPPINLKYYGFKISKADGHKQAFLLDGEDIILATENETVKKRYRIVRIAQTSIDIEDTQAKSTQTLKLQDIPT